MHCTDQREMPVSREISLGDLWVTGLSSWLQIMLKELNFQFLPGNSLIIFLAPHPLSTRMQKIKTVVSRKHV